MKLITFLFATITLTALLTDGSPRYICKNNIPDFPRQGCINPDGCTTTSPLVTVNSGGKPVSIVTNPGGTTTICYDLRLISNTSDPCGAGNNPLSGISFIVDECCPTLAPSTEFLHSVAVNSPNLNLSIRTDQCTEGNSSVAFANMCTRTKRPCESDPHEMCSVLNVNDLSVQPGTPIEYCVSIYGTNFDVVPPTNQLDPDVKGNAKFCFERGSTCGGSNNLCSCVDVSFVKSTKLCASSVCKAPPVFPHDSECQNSCDSKSNWNVSFVQRVFLNDTNRTTFVYSASSIVIASSSKKGRKKRKGSKGKSDKKPCESNLEEWSLRLESCCGVGVLNQEILSGRVTLHLNGEPCPPTICQVRNDENGDTITIKHTSYTTEPNIFAISFPGNIQISSGGSVCARGKSPSFCSCKEIESPNVCDFDPLLIVSISINSQFHGLNLHCDDPNVCQQQGINPPSIYEFTWDEFGFLTVRRQATGYQCDCFLIPGMQNDCCQDRIIVVANTAVAGSIANVRVGGNGIVDHFDVRDQTYCIPGNGGIYNFVWMGNKLNITMPSGTTETVILSGPQNVVQEAGFTITWDIA